MYSAPYSDAAATAAGMAAYFPALAADQPPFYSNAVSINNYISCSLLTLTNFLQSLMVILAAITLTLKYICTKSLNIPLLY